VNTAKLIIAVIATRDLPIKNAKITNSAGVSLIAAARPIKVPCGIRRRSPGASGSRSATTKAIRMVFTWPYPSVVRIGSTANSTAMPISPSFQPRGAPQRFKTDC
jgi:hypothetical protein